MPPRLLSLLSSVETCLENEGSSAVTTRPERSVNFQKGIARMVFADGSGSVTLQNFTLADGQLCVKAEFGWAQTDAISSCAIYPTPENYDWLGASYKIAQAWMAGPKQEASPANVSSSASSDRMVTAS